MKDNDKNAGHWYHECRLQNQVKKQDEEKKTGDTFTSHTQTNKITIMIIIEYKMKKTKVNNTDNNNNTTNNNDKKTWLYVLIISRTRSRVNPHSIVLWSLSDCNWTWTHNHLVHKRTLNHSTKLAKWLSVQFESGFEKLGSSPVSIK